MKTKTEAEIEKLWTKYKARLGAVERADLRLVKDQAKRLPEAEEKVGDLSSVIVARGYEIDELTAQRDSLASLIMGLNEETIKITEKFSLGSVQLIKNLQRDAQQILGPSWRNPLKEVVDAVMGAEVPDHSDVSCLGPDTMEEAFISGAEQMLENLQTTIKGIWLSFETIKPLLQSKAVPVEREDLKELLSMAASYQANFTEDQIQDNWQEHDENNKLILKLKTLLEGNDG